MKEKKITNSIIEYLLTKQKISIPIISVLCGFFIGILLMIFTGYNPFDLFIAILRGTFGINLQSNTSRNFFNARYIGEYFVYVMPIILTGLSVAFALRVNLFNIGSEGQLMMGSWAAISVGISFPNLPQIILLPMVIIAGIITGALWGVIPGILKAKFNIHEVVVTIMLNYAALYFTNFGYLQLPRESMVKTNHLPDAALLHSDFLSSITRNSRLHWGFILVIIAIIVFFVIINKTTFGYELKATGYNLKAANLAGIKVNTNIMFSMMIAGAFAGLAGVIIATGTFSYGRVLPGFENYGFDGIGVALIGNNSAIGVLFAGLLFGSLKSAQPIMQTRKIPRDIITIIIATVIIMMAMQHGIRMLLQHIQKRNKRKKEKNKNKNNTSTITYEKRKDFQ